MTIEVLESKRKYYSSVGEDVKRTSDYFNGRFVKYTVEDGSDVEEKNIYINEDDLSYDATIEDIRQYLEDLENS